MFHAVRRLAADSFFLAAEMKFSAAAKRAWTTTAARGFCHNAFLAAKAPPKPTKRAVLRDIFIGGSLGLSGDYICQKWIEGAEEIDPRRMFALSTFGAFYTGALCHYVYPWYIVIVVRHFPTIFTRSALGLGMGATVLDNFIHNPIFYIPAFYLYTDTVQGLGGAEAVGHLKSEWVEVAGFCFVIWVPLQLLNFTVVPPAGRVAFVNVVNLVWNIIIDYLSARNTAQSGESVNVEIMPGTC